MTETVCDTEVLAADGEYDPCGERSRFAVQRSDHDPTYDAAPDRAPAEACEAHLAETVMGLMDGDDKIHAVVTPHWDGGGSHG